MSFNLPPGCTEADVDRTVSDEPEYDLTEADLDEAYAKELEPFEDWERINAKIDAILMESRIGKRNAA